MKKKIEKHRKDLATFIHFQITKHGLSNKSDTIWAEIARNAITFGVSLEKSAYRVLHDYCRRYHYIISDALKYRQDVLESYKRHPENRVYSNKDLLKRTSWWRRAYK